MNILKVYDEDKKIKVQNRKKVNTTGRETRLPGSTFKLFPDPLSVTAH